MGRKLRTTVTESTDHLSLLKRKQTTLRNVRKVEVLLLLKTEVFSKLDDIAKSLCISASTLDKWLRIYREHGISEYLSPIKPKRKSKLITAEIRSGLEKRLCDPEGSFLGFWDARDWIKQTYGVEINYQWLWKYMTTSLGAKIKMPGKSNVKKDPKAKAAFLKSSPTSSGRSAPTSTNQRSIQ